MLTGIHDSLGGGTDRNRLLKVGLASVFVVSKAMRTDYDAADLRSRDPSDLRRESLDVILFPLQNLGRNEHGEVRVLDAHRLDLLVEPLCQSYEQEPPQITHQSVRPWMISQMLYDQGLRM